MAAVAQDGKALQWAGEEMKGDRELCMAAVAQDGKALQWASEDMQNDPKIRTLAAVHQEAKALKEAPEELKKDKEFMITVMKANGMALKQIGKEMKGDRELCKIDFCGADLKCCVVRFPEESVLSFKTFLFFFLLQKSQNPFLWAEAATLPRGPLVNACLRIAEARRM